MLGFHRQTFAYLWPAWSKPEEMGLKSLVGIIWGWFTDLISSGMIWANKKSDKTAGFTFSEHLTIKKMGLRPWRGRTSTSPKLPENKPLEVVIHVWIVVSLDPVLHHIKTITGSMASPRPGSCRRVVVSAQGDDRTSFRKQWFDHHWHTMNN